MVEEHNDFVNHMKDIHEVKDTQSLSFSIVSAAGVCRASNTAKLCSVFFWHIHQYILNQYQYQWKNQHQVAQNNNYFVRQSMYKQGMGGEGMGKLEASVVYDLGVGP